METVEEKVINAFDILENQVSQMDKIYDNAMKNINIVLENNYNIFNSISDSLNIISNYNTKICEETLENINRINIIAHTFDKINKSLEIYTKYLNNKTLTNKRIEYIALFNKLTSNNLDYLEELVENYNISDINISDNLKIPETVLPTYISYSFKEKEETSIIEAYDNSYIKEIKFENKKIIDNMKKINIIANNEIFKMNEERIELAYNIRNIVINEDGFKDLLNYLYKGIYECSGSGNNRIMDIIKNEPEENIMMLIKYYRNFYNHELTNGEKKIEKVIAFNRSSIKKSFPSKQSEWTKLQLAFYKEINKMLDKTIEVLDNQCVPV